MTRGLRCCARDRLATVPRNVRISSFIRRLACTGRLPICMAHTSGFYFRLAGLVCVCSAGVCAARAGVAACVCALCSASAETATPCCPALFRLFLNVPSADADAGAASPGAHNRSVASLYSYLSCRFNICRQPLFKPPHAQRPSTFQNFGTSLC